MKKILSFIAASTVALTLASCFGGGDSNNNGSSQKPASGITDQSQDLIKRADGTVIKLGGYKTAPKKSTAPMFTPNLRGGNLPPKVDLRRYMTTVEDQGQIGSCTANATAGAYEYLLNRNQGVSNYDVSRLFLYYNTRAIRHQENQDAGGIISDVLETLNKDGICNEKTWPYVENRFRQKPNAQSYEEALKNKISKYACVPNDLDSWKSALAEGYPIIFGITIFPSFQNPRNGKISMPKRGERPDGGHAMCCVGYSDPDRVFIVRNSWGHQWGDGGYCYIPYDYMMNSEYNDGDSWVIYDVNPISQADAEEAWSDDTESIFVDMENEFADMPDDQWEAMCDELGDYDIVFRLGALYNIACWGDEEMAPEEGKLAIEKLKKILVMFGLNYSPKKVFKHCEKIWVNEDNFFEETVEILGRYLSEGARATIAADMLEICNADGDAADDERDIILGLVGEWLNDDLIEAYYSDYYDEEDEDYYDYYDDEDDYYYDDDFDYGDECDYDDDYYDDDDYDDDYEDDYYDDDEA